MITNATGPTLAGFLAVFLLERIAEDEAAVARVADSFPQVARRVLADCEAKRRVVERCVRLSKTPGNERAREAAVDILSDLAAAYDG